MNYFELRELQDEGTREDYNREAFGWDVEHDQNQGCPECGEEQTCERCKADVAEGNVEPVAAPTPKHTMKSSRSSGRDSWLIVCTCGRRFKSWRWLAEEDFNEHKA